MLAPIVLVTLVAHASITAPATAPQDPPVSPSQATTEQPWPPAGVLRQGPGVTSPKLVAPERPDYPAEVLRRGVEGSVLMEAVVLTDGTIGEVRVLRSVDRKYGLDEACVATLKKWRFSPGEKDGVPVPVLVDVEMSFALKK
jgi:protein TonB